MGKKKNRKKFIKIDESYQLSDNKNTFFQPHEPLEPSKRVIFSPKAQQKVEVPPAALVAAEQPEPDDFELQISKILAQEIPAQESIPQEISPQKVEKRCIIL